MKTNKGFIVPAIIIFVCLILGSMIFLAQTQPKEVPTPLPTGDQPATTTATTTVGNPDKTPREKVLTAGRFALIAMRDEDYAKLEALTSAAGLTLNEIPNLDFSKRDFKKEEVSDIKLAKMTRMWGYTDGKGDEINLTPYDYMKKYIYNHAYDAAPEVAVNEILGTGNSINTVLKDAAGRTVVAYHYDGFNPEYSGMDWTTMYLVFDLENGEYKLRGIAKDNWTI